MDENLSLAKAALKYVAEMLDLAIDEEGQIWLSKYESIQVYDDSHLLVRNNCPEPEGVVLYFAPPQKESVIEVRGNDERSLTHVLRAICFQFGTT